MQYQDSYEHRCRDINCQRDTVTLPAANVKIEMKKIGSTVRTQTNGAGADAASPQMAVCVRHYSRLTRERERVSLVAVSVVQFTEIQITIYYRFSPRVRQGNLCTRTAKHASEKTLHRPHTVCVCVCVCQTSSLPIGNPVILKVINTDLSIRFYWFYAFERHNLRCIDAMSAHRLPTINFPF